MDGAYDVDSELGAAPQQTAPARPVAPAPQISPLPNEPDASLITRAVIAEGDPNNAQSYQNIAGVILNRAHASGKPVRDILSEPDQFESYQNGHIQGVNPNSSLFQWAGQQIAPVLNGQVTVPYDSFYNPTIVKQRGVAPPFDQTKGTMIGSQVFGSGFYRPQGTSVGAATAAKAGLYDVDAELGAGAPSPATNPLDALKHPEIPPNDPNSYQSFLAQRTKEDEANDIAAGLPPGEMRGPQGVTIQARHDYSDKTMAPQYDAWLKARVIAQTHSLTGDVAAGAGQGAIDVAASANRLTGGGLAVGDPMMAAFAQTQGGPSASDIASAGKEAFRQQNQNAQRLYSGDPYFQGGRFGAQLAASVPATLAVPEIKGAATLTNALRGVAGVAPSVGANPTQPVALQLGEGALTGIVAPKIFNAGLNTAGRIFGAGGFGRTVSPKVAALGELAQEKYGIPLQSGQVVGKMGATDAQNEAWMRGVTGSFGDQSGDISPEHLAAQQKSIGGEIGAFASRVPIINARQVPQKLDDLVASAAQTPGIGTAELRPVKNLIANIKSVIGPDGTMTGAAYTAQTRQDSPLMRGLAKDSTGLAGQIKDILDDALEGSAAPEDVAGLRDARWRYKNLQTVIKAAPSANVEGVIKPSALASAINSQFKNRGTQGAANLGELSQIYSQFLAGPRTAAPVKTGLTNGLGIGLGIGGGSELAQQAIEHLTKPGGGALLNQAINSAPYALLGGGALVAGNAIRKGVVNALENSRNFGPATGILARSLPNAPRSALAGIGTVAQGTRKAVEIPLSALAGVRLMNPTPAAATP